MRHLANFVLPDPADDADDTCPRLYRADRCDNDGSRCAAWRDLAAIRR